MKRIIFIHQLRVKLIYSCWHGLQDNTVSISTSLACFSAELLNLPCRWHRMWFNSRLDVTIDNAVAYCTHTHAVAPSGVGALSLGKPSSIVSMRQSSSLICQHKSITWASSFSHTHVLRVCSTIAAAVVVTAKYGCCHAATHSRAACLSSPSSYILFQRCIPCVQNQPTILKVDPSDRDPLLDELHWFSSLMLRFW